MKFSIKFTFLKGIEPVEGEIKVGAEDVRHALRLCETDLDVLGAKVDSITPEPENSKSHTSTL